MAFQPRAQQSKPFASRTPNQASPATRQVTHSEEAPKAKASHLVKVKGEDGKYVKVGAIITRPLTRVNKSTGKEETVQAMSVILDEGVPTGVFLNIFENTPYEGPRK